MLWGDAVDTAVFGFRPCTIVRCDHTPLVQLLIDRPVRRTTALVVYLVYAGIQTGLILFAKEVVLFVGFFQAIWGDISERAIEILQGKHRGSSDTHRLYRFGHGHRQYQAKAGWILYRRPSCRVIRVCS